MGCSCPFVGFLADFCLLFVIVLFVFVDLLGCGTFELFYVVVLLMVVCFRVAGLVWCCLGFGSLCVWLWSSYVYCVNSVGQCYLSVKC